MCSILGILNIKGDASRYRKQAIQLSRNQRHRGPDWSGTFVGEDVVLVHERLSIVDVESGAQPLFGTDDQTVLAVNGEIYNHKHLAETLAANFDFKTASDCEVLLGCYEAFEPEQISEWLNQIKGMFAFILYDRKDNSFVIARDPIGIIPLYTGYDAEGNFYVASEMKAISSVCESIQTFPPGHYLSSKEGKITQYYKKDWRDYEAVKGKSSEAQIVHDALTESVKRHLMTDVPYGVLLSGGLDSSLVAAITKKFADKRVEDNDQSAAWWPTLHTFAIGLEGAPDLIAAQKVADYIGTNLIDFSASRTSTNGISVSKDGSEKDGFDINKLQLGSVRRQIGIVPQDSLLFDGSIKDNISLTSPNSSPDDIVAAARVACAHDFIMDLPEGYATRVGERGSGLSGGQRQRIAIARAVLQRPSLLILDEATSALDYLTERQVCLNLKKEFEGSTVFFITHRLSTIRSADHILMMESGRLVEQGTHLDLIDLQGRYYALYSQQESDNA